MHAVDLIAAAISAVDQDRPDVTEARVDGVCCLTGRECSTIARKAVLGPSFTDGALLARPDSDRIGVSAATAFRYKWERMSSWICDGDIFQRLDRVGVRHAVLSNPPARAWCAYATTSYKKHGSVRAPVNAAGRRVWLFENRIVDLAQWDEVWPRLLHARTNGVPRPVLESLEANGKVMRDYGVAAWMCFEDWARPRIGSPVYAFACYLLPSEEELRGKQDRPNAVSPARDEAGVSASHGTTDLFT